MFQSGNRVEGVMKSCFFELKFAFCLHGPLREGNVDAMVPMAWEVQTLIWGFTNQSYTWE